MNGRFKPPTFKDAAARKRLRYGSRITNEANTAVMIPRHAESYSFFPQILVYRRHFDVGLTLEKMDRGVSLAQEAGFTGMQMIVGAHKSLLLTAVGAVAQAKPIAQQARTVADSAIPLFAPLAISSQMMVALAENDVAQAFVIYQPEFYYLCGVALAGLDRKAAARDALYEGVGVLQRTNGRLWHLEIASLLIELEVQAGNPAAADRVRQAARRTVDFVRGSLLQSLRAAFQALPVVRGLL